MLPASEVEAIREQTRYKWALFMKDWTAAAAHRQAREDAIAATEIADRQTVNDPVAMGTSRSFRRQVGR